MFPDTDNCSDDIEEGSVCRRVLAVGIPEQATVVRATIAVALIRLAFNKDDTDSPLTTYGSKILIGYIVINYIINYIFRSIHIRLNALWIFFISFFSGGHGCG